MYGFIAGTYTYSSQINSLLIAVSIFKGVLIVSTKTRPKSKKIRKSTSTVFKIIRKMTRHDVIRLTSK